MTNILYRNFKNWQDIINFGVGKWFDGLIIKQGDLIDADSVPVPVKPSEVMTSTIAPNRTNKSLVRFLPSNDTSAPTRGEVMPGGAGDRATSITPPLPFNQRWEYGRQMIKPFREKVSR